MPVPVSVPLAEVELGRQRRGRRLSPSPTAAAPHRPQGKRKAPEERDKARAAQPAARHSASPGMETQSRMEMGRGAAPEVSWGAVPPDPHPHNAAGPLVKAKTVKRPEGTDTPRTSRASSECQKPQGSFSLCTLFARSCGKGAAHPTEPLPCRQPSRRWLPRCRERWPWQAVKCPSAVGPLRASSLNTCWIRVSTAQPSPATSWPSLVPKFRSHPQAGGRGEGELELPLASLAGSSKTGSRAGDEPYTPAASEEPEARSRSHSLKPPAQPKASQSVQTTPSYVFTPILCSCQGCGGGLFLHGIMAMAWGCPPVPTVPLQTPSCIANRTGNPNCTSRASCQQPPCTARTLCPTR